MADRVGQKLGNYQLVRLLGQGGFAEVYLGEHVHLGTLAAIKVLHTQLARNDLEQFRTEARTIARLVHPHIVRVLEFGVEGSTPFLVMDYAPNGSLRERHPQKAPLPVATVVSYTTQVADALQYAHDEKLIHRDVKPENMLLGRRNEVLLSDFGIALVAQSSRSLQTQDLAGTIAYMAPEQIQAHPRPASDQYSLGIVVYEWLSGDRPFHGSFTEIAIKHSIVPPPSLREKLPALSADVEQVVMIALAKDPKERFGSVKAFAVALEQASKSSSGMVELQVQPPPSIEATASMNQVPLSTQIGTPAGQMSSPTAQVTPPEQPSQPVERASPQSQFSQLASTAPPQGQHFTNTITPRNEAAIVTGGSVKRVPSPRRTISPRMMVVSLAVLITVVLAGGGITWLALSHGPANGGGTSFTGNTPIGTSSGSGNGAVIGSTTIKIATDLPVSGADTSGGKPAENGAHLAVNQANASHTIPGYTLVFDPKDDVGPSGAHDPAVGTQNITALVGDALVAGMVGPFNSNVAAAEMPTANHAPLAMISPSNTNPCLTQEGADVGCSGASDLVPTLRPTGKVTYFRIVTTDNYEGTASADYLYKTLHYAKVYVMDDAETYGVVIANAFAAQWRNLGGTVLGHSSEPGTTTSYVSLLTQIATLHPDVIYFGGLDSSGGTLIRQQMQQVPGLQNTPFAGGDGIMTSSFASTIGTSGGPVYGGNAVVDTSQNPAAQAFIREYEAAFTDSMNAYSALAYDCTNILIQAIKMALANGAHTPRDSNDAAGARAFRQAVIAAIQGISYTGVTGHQSFDANGDTTNRIITIYQLAVVSGQPDWKYIANVS